MESNESVLVLHTTFSKASKEAKANGNEALTQFYGLLSQIFSLYYKFDSPQDPFGPMMVLHGSRTAIVSDFSEMNLDVLSHIAGKGSAQVNARLNDVLWLRRKDRKDAEAAINSYLDHTKQTLKAGEEGWIHGYESLERACQIWKQIGRPEQFVNALQGNWFRP